MTEQQKKYIEANIDLIENDKWKEFFKNAPRGTGEVLYSARIDFMTWMKQVPPECFRGSALTSITVPNNVTSIGDDAFYYCTSLTSINIPDSVISIGDAAFYDCRSLTSIVIPDSVTSIGDCAFEFCYSLTSIEIPESVTSIGHYAFAYCRRLKSITISSSMINIKSDAFNSIESDVVINFNGTKQQWKNLISDDIAVFKNTRYTCNCVDGAVRKSR